MGCKYNCSYYTQKVSNWINSYIVGCKLNRNAMSALLHVRINSYIVGCKYHSIEYIGVYGP